MRFAKQLPPSSAAAYEAARLHWAQFGWSRIPPADEAAVRAAWVSHLQPAGSTDLDVPRPSRTWRQIPSDLPESAEEDFTLKLLGAFRRCTPPGERLLAIDWQHEWYYFDPHAGITAATLDEWAMPVLPDGDAYHFLAADFRFGVVSDWRSTGPIRMFGRQLLDAFDAAPPNEFLRLCGTGQDR
jgi:hypothetical protein